MTKENRDTLQQAIGMLVAIRLMSNTKVSDMLYCVSDMIGTVIVTEDKSEVSNEQVQVS